MTAAQDLAERIKARIMRGELAQGVPLPPERQLAEHERVSRTTVRGALSLLAAEGFVRRRVGRGGGTFVTRPDAESVAASIRLAVGSAGLDAADLAEARAHLEPVCARLAAERIGEDALARLDRLQSRMARAADLREFLADNSAFHRLIAEASGNSVLAGLLKGLDAPIHELTDDPAVVTRARMHETVRAHEAILFALRRRDPVQAAAAMRKHLLAHAELIESPYERGRRPQHGVAPAGRD
ncbi:FadR/GntR family transcriptional regulator [Sediminivirga luteola]|uniref:GntR family transcriptional regulator n=1 Tax=Sediminivirga luteola TaxID=1774748 RepID=A0A8J2TVH4_9MICO|nr:FCD domain-containing protein [Sediminivirga luteola]GGA03982.1 GntR family transcriptional regulator [Sediminivirga luteola]